MLLPSANREREGSQVGRVLEVKRRQATMINAGARAHLQTPGTHREALLDLLLVARHVLAPHDFHALIVQPLVDAGHQNVPIHTKPAVGVHPQSLLDRNREGPVAVQDRPREFLVALEEAGTDLTVEEPFRFCNLRR